MLNTIPSMDFCYIFSLGKSQDHKIPNFQNKTLTTQYCNFCLLIMFCTLYTFLNICTIVYFTIYLSYVFTPYFFLLSLNVLYSSKNFRIMFFLLH